MEKGIALNGFSAPAFPSGKHLQSVQFHSLRNSVLHASWGERGDGVPLFNKNTVRVVEFKVTLVSLICLPLI